MIRNEANFENAKGTLDKKGKIDGKYCWLVERNNNSQPNI